MKSKAIKSLGLAVMAFAAAVGCSSEETGLNTDILTSQSQFRAQAEELLQKQGYGGAELKDYEFFEKSGGDPVAILTYSASDEAGKGEATVSCSSREVLHMGTHCQIASFKPEMQ